MPELAEIQRAWDTAAVAGAREAILTIPGMGEQAFWDSGAREIARVLAHLDERHELPPSRQDAMDFGCGVGRLTVALAGHFQRVLGVDISREMIRRAKKARGVTYRRCRSLESLARGDRRFDFIYSNITLQHVPRQFQERYVKDFIRLLQNGGLAVFEIPECPAPVGYVGEQTMYGTPRRDVRRWIQGARGGTLLETEPTDSGGPGAISWRYVVRKGQA